MVPAPPHTALGEPPNPDGTATVDELSARLRLLQSWAGVSYRETHRRVLRSRRERGIPELPAYNTVYRCLRPGRTRLDVELVVDVARALLGDDVQAAAWRQACQVVAGLADQAAIVTVSDTLPADLGIFVGRTDELAALLDAMAGTPRRDGVICEIEGMAGSGKTALAVHAAHRLLEQRRPIDIRLAVNLRGYDPHRQPADPIAVLEGFLRALGVPGSQIHDLDLARRASLFNELLADRHALILLDNAASEDQVRSLVPHGDHCRVLVTSRRRLAGLAGRHLTLGPFSPADALALLRNSVGDARVEAEPEAATGIVELVGRLPLAVSLVANRVTGHPAWTLSDHLARIAERHAGLRLDDGVEVALTTSYAGLPPALQRLLRMLALQPGRDFDAYAAAALADIDVSSAQVLLSDLLAASLVQQHGAGRYELHDLIHVFAANRASDEDSLRDRRAALDRLFAHYRYTAARAMDVHSPQEKHRRPEVADPGTATPDLPDRDSAIQWLEAERANLIAAAVYASDHGWPVFTAGLSRILFRYLDVAGHYRDAEILHTRASLVGDDRGKAHALINLAIVRITVGQRQEALDPLQRAMSCLEQTDDRSGHGRALAALGGLYWRLGRYPEAHEHLQRAIAVFHELGDRVAEGITLNTGGLVSVQSGRYLEAIAAFERARGIASAVGDLVGEGHALINLGRVYVRMADYPHARTHLRQGLAAAHSSGNPVAEADALNQLGTLACRLRRYQQASTYFRTALATTQRYGIRELEVQSLDGLARLCCERGEPQQGLSHHRQALAIADELGDRYQLALAHDGIAQANAALAHIAGARAHWSTSLALHTALGTPEADEVAVRLRTLDGDPVLTAPAAT